jgi:hypothetical protein
VIDRPPLVAMMTTSKSSQLYRTSSCCFNHSEELLIQYSWVKSQNKEFLSLSRRESGTSPAPQAQNKIREVLCFFTSSKTRVQ